MTREDHQPWDCLPERPDRTPEEWRAICGRTIAFVLAFGAHVGDAADIGAAVDAGCQAHMPGVFVLADDEHASVAMDAVRAGRSKESGVLVDVVGYSPASAIALTRDAADFEMCGLPYGLLVAMREAASQGVDDYESVVALSATRTGITAHHLYELCQDMRAHPDADAIASWITWLRRPPFVLSHAFLDSLQDSPLVQRRADGTRPVGRIALRDHGFGEEMLASLAPVATRATRFLHDCTMSALQAVQLAKFSRAHPGEPLHSPNQALSLIGPSEPQPLNDADALLVRAASEAIAASDGADGAELAELAWADAFGVRNKRDFPLLNDRMHGGKLAYLDSAATSQRLGAALQAQHDYDLHENANVYRGAYELSAQSTFTFNDARKRLEDFIGAERRTTVFTMNATAAMNLVAQAWGERNIAAGDCIVCALSDHHSATLPFALLSERVGADMVYVPFDDSGRLDREEFARALERKPKLVCLTHVGNVFGIAQPVKQLADEAHEAGARVLVDAAQSFAHGGVDVRELGADWVAFSAHKAYGPMGIGALWISDGAFDEMDPRGGGGGTVSHVSTESYYLRPKALQYEPGTPPVSQAVGWAAAIDYLDALGKEDIARHDEALTRYAVRGLQRIDGVNVLGDHSRADGQTGLVSFTVRSATPSDVAGFLAGLGVAVRSGGHCALPLHAALGLVGSSRISIGVYTTRDDIDAALAAVALCRQAYEPCR